MKSLLFASSVLALAACGPKAAPKTPDPQPDHGGGATGPVYAKLFEMGASWELDVHTEDSDYDDQGEPTTSKDDFKAVCQVDRVSEVGGVTLSNITCDESWPQTGGGDLMSGVWASNDQGAWHLMEWPADGAAPDLSGPMVFAVSPVEDTRSEEFEEGSSQTVISRKGDAWCYEESWAAGDDGWSSICLDAIGPTEGSFGWGGGSVHDTKFTRAQ